MSKWSRTKVLAAGVLRGVKKSPRTLREHIERERALCDYYRRVLEITDDHAERTGKICDRHIDEIQRLRAENAALCARLAEATR